jgi:RNA polymerase sigma-70 factor, ECF subfamily
VQTERLERLFRDHARDVLAYARRRTDPATAEEVVAEVFAVAWRRLDRVPREAGVVLNCSAAAVHTRLHRARRRLEAALADRRATGSFRPSEVNAR